LQAAESGQPSANRFIFKVSDVSTAIYDIFIAQ